LYNDLIETSNLMEIDKTPPSPLTLKTRNVSAACGGAVVNPRRLKTTNAEWITKAITSSQTKSLALAEINEWMAANVPGLKDQKFLHSSQGWKNAVRHTLSVNRGRFEKVPREGRPSLWTLTEKYGVNFDAGADVMINNKSLSESTTMTPTNVVEKMDKDKCSAMKNSVVVPFAIEKHMKTSHESLQLPTTPPMKQNQQYSDIIAAPSTQTIQVVFNDGVVAVVVLPKPLPVCNYGSASDSPLYNSVGQVAGMKPLWDDSQAAFLTQALLRHRSSSTSSVSQNNFPITGCFG